MDLNRVAPKTWVALGECASKCEHVANVALKPAVSQKLMEVNLRKGVQATTAIEGNTLTEEEIQDVMNKGQEAVPPSRQYMAKEVQNVLVAFAECWQGVITEDVETISPDLIRHWHSLVLAGLELPEHVTPGDYRNCQVGAGTYRSAPPEDVAYLMDRYCQMLNDFPMPKDQRIAYALIKAVVAHLYLAWIHPFGDGNGRTARLIELYFLASSGCPQPCVHLLSNHYNKTRSKYYLRLDEARKGAEGVVKFIEYAVQGFLDGLREQVDLIQGYQLRVAWESYIHEKFGKLKGEANRRRRDLILAMPFTGFISSAEIPDLSTEMARYYSKLTPKAITRDINALERMDLLVIKGRKVSPKIETIFAFMPHRKIEV
ncbi:MAG: Fic family protein [Deltaproteobacteria bacterium]|nr:Fic family protein [Deltaproteobacteria bacterium]